MFTSKNISTGHKDLINDVAFDFYGRRMATCSSDRIVKIWSLDTDGEWVCTNAIDKDNNCGAIWKVTWAHPSFGSKFATCSFDRKVRVFNEKGYDNPEQSIKSEWESDEIVDFSSSVKDIKFAPKRYDLLLAACFDSSICIFEPQMASWARINTINTELPSCSCISWDPSPSQNHPKLIAAGSDDQKSCPKVAIYELSDTNQDCKSKMVLNQHTEPVNDIAFAPNMGRSYHLLAVASNVLCLYAIVPKPRNESQLASSFNFDVKKVKIEADNDTLVWRISWNILGNILCSTDQEDQVKLWKANCKDKWSCISIISSDSIVCPPTAKEAPPAQACMLAAHVGLGPLGGLGSRGNLGVMQY